MIEGKAILLDTCVVNNVLSKERKLAEVTANLISELLENGNILYISEFTHYELLRGANSEKRKKATDELKRYITISQSSERLERSTLLWTAYQNAPSIKGNLNSISDIDVFIGSLVFTDQHPLLLTADFNDFPRPFFKEVEIASLSYEKSRGNKACQYYYFLEANNESLFQ